MSYPDYDLYKNQRGMAMNFSYNSRWVHPLPTNSWSRGARAPSTPATTFSSAWGNRGKVDGELPVLPKPVRSFSSTWGASGHSAIFEPSYHYGTNSFAPVRPQTPNYTSYEPVKRGVRTLPVFLSLISVCSPSVLYLPLRLSFSLSHLLARVCVCVKMCE